MKTLFIKYIKELLNEKNFCCTMGKEIFTGDNCIIVPFFCEDGKYFLKFFINGNLSQICAEIELVKYFFDIGLPVPQFFSFGEASYLAKKINSQNFYCFATKEIDFFSISKPTLSQLIKSTEVISLLHNSINKYNWKHLNLNIITDFQRLFNLIVTNYSFFNSNGILQSVEDVLRFKHQKSKLIPIHSDLRMENILFMNNDLKAIIDFSDIRVSCIEDDIGRFIQYLSYTKDIKFDIINEIISKYQVFSQQILNLKLLRISIIYNTLFRLCSDYLYLNEREKETYFLKAKETIEYTNKFLK